MMKVTEARNRNGYVTIALRFHIQSPGPFLHFLHFIQGSRVQGRLGVGGAVNVFIRAGSPLENTQRYLYILLEKAPHRAPGVRVRRRTLVLSNLLPLSDETRRDSWSRDHATQPTTKTHPRSARMATRLSQTDKCTPVLIQNLPQSSVLNVSNSTLHVTEE